MLGFIGGRPAERLRLKIVGGFALTGNGGVEGRVGAPFEESFPSNLFFRFLSSCESEYDVSLSVKLENEPSLCARVRSNLLVNNSKFKKETKKAKSVHDLLCACKNHYCVQAAKWKSFSE